MMMLVHTQPSPCFQYIGLLRQLMRDNSSLYICPVLGRPSSECPFERTPRMVGCAFHQPPMSFLLVDETNGSPALMLDSLARIPSYSLGDQTLPRLLATSAPSTGLFLLCSPTSLLTLVSLHGASRNLSTLITDLLAPKPAPSITCYP